MTHCASLGLSGTVYDATGFGSWGIEPTVVIETAPHAPGLFSALFDAYPNEQALWAGLSGAVHAAGRSPAGGYAAKPVGCQWVDHGKCLYYLPRSKRHHHSQEHTMRGYLSRGFKRVDESDPFYTPPKTSHVSPADSAATRADNLADAQAEADAARELGQGRASQALQDQADVLREDLESKGE